MNKYDVKKHLFYDGYDLDNVMLGNIQFINNLLEEINNNIFSGEGKIKLIPYFDGKVKNDGGISGLILGDNFHFTCHTFSFKNTVFVDYFGDDKGKSGIEEILLKTFDTNNYDMGSKDVKGNFGKHIIFNTKPFSVDEAISMVQTILKEIEMTPISETFVNQKDENNFDVLQLIAESHISFHRCGDEMVVDVFSCKNYNVSRLLRMFDVLGDYIEVNRGLKYI